MSSFTESVVEDAALAWLEALGYAILHGPEIAVGELAAEHHFIYTLLAYIRNLRIIGKWRPSSSSCLLSSATGRITWTTTPSEGLRIS